MPLKNLQTRIVTQAPSSSPPGGIGPAIVVIGTLAILDVTNPSAPSTSVINTSAVAQNNACMGVDSNNRAYVLSGQAEPVVPPNDLQIIDISNRASPSILSTTPVNAGGLGYRMVFKTVGGVLYMVLVRASGGAIASSDIMEVFNVNNPAAPVSVQTYNISSAFAFSQTNASAALLTGNTMVVTAADTIAFYNLSALPVITQISGTNFADGRTRTVRDVTATHAFVETRAPGELIIYNITVPAAPTVTGNLVMPETLETLSNLDNNKIYGTRFFANSLDVFDVSNLAAPSLASTIAVAAFSIYQTARGANNAAYISIKTAFAGSPAKLNVYDAAGAPVLKSSTVYSPLTTPSTQQLHTDITGFIT